MKRITALVITCLAMPALANDHPFFAKPWVHGAHRSGAAEFPESTVYAL